MHQRKGKQFGAEISGRKGTGNIPGLGVEMGGTFFLLRACDVSRGKRTAAPTSGQSVRKWAGITAGGIKVRHLVQPDKALTWMVYSERDSV